MNPRPSHCERDALPLSYTPTWVFLRVLDGTLFVNPVILRVPRFVKAFPGKGDSLLEVFDLVVEAFVADES